MFVQKTGGHKNLESFHMEQPEEKKKENGTKASWDLRLTPFQKLIVVKFFMAENLQLILNFTWSKTPIIVWERNHETGVLKQWE